MLSALFHTETTVHRTSICNLCTGWTTTGIGRYMYMHIYSTNTYETESLSISNFNNGKLGILAVTLLFREVAPIPPYLENCIHKILSLSRKYYYAKNY